MRSYEHVSASTFTDFTWKRGPVVALDERVVLSVLSALTPPFLSDEPVNSTFLPAYFDRSTSVLAISVQGELDGAAAIEASPAAAGEFGVADWVNVKVPSVPATMQPVTRLLSLAFSLE